MTTNSPWNSNNGYPFVVPPQYGSLTSEQLKAQTKELEKQKNNRTIRFFSHYLFGFIIATLLFTVLLSATYVVFSRAKVDRLMSLKHRNGHGISSSSHNAQTVTSRVVPSVVTLHTDSNYGAGGSGVILHVDGEEATILTTLNAIGYHHPSHITVIFWDHSRATATVLGTDAGSDVAVLHVHKTGLTPIDIAEPRKLLVGEQVFAIGNQLGNLETVSAGIISSLHRPFVSDIPCVKDRIHCVYNLIQTDVGVNLGEYGGALIDSLGYLIGLVNYNQQSFSSAQQKYMPRNGRLNYALPLHGATLRFADLLAHHRPIHHSHLGISVELDLNNPIPSAAPGVALLGVKSAELRAQGVEKGDRIIEINDVPLFGSKQIFYLKNTILAGDKITIKIKKKNTNTMKTITYTVHE